MKFHEAPLLPACFTLPVAGADLRAASVDRRLFGALVPWSYEPISNSIEGRASGGIEYHNQFIDTYIVTHGQSPAFNAASSRTMDMAITFHYKSKHVTDIENKFKFFFRQMPRETLLKLGFHARV